MTRIGILDLGTNTFHILIVKVSPEGQYTPLLRKREFVKLGANGVDNIGAIPYQRGLSTMVAFQSHLNHYKVDIVKSIGTAALRTAKNGSQFIEEVYHLTGIKIDLIDGLQEATYIYKGVKQIWNQPISPSLIMDIGGGSVEFILATQYKLLWAKSYPIGASVLRRNFHHTDPIHFQEIQAISTWLDTFLSDLKQIIFQYKPKILIGASGTFDVLSEILVPTNDNQPYKESYPRELELLLDEIASLTEKERMADQRIPDSRVDLIVVACLLIKYILQTSVFKKIGYSSYALKEGVASDLISNLD
jgi:exopolyphosphatase/guanosine-5'-triphosphate,3'-diphosphate pyrophosphatase